MRAVRHIIFWFATISILISGAIMPEADEMHDTLLGIGMIGVCLYIGYQIGSYIEKQRKIKEELEKIKNQL